MRNKRIYRGIRWFIFLFFPVCVLGQNEEIEKGLIRSIIKAGYGENLEEMDLNLSQQPYSVSLGEENDLFTVYFYVIACDDFNEDGIPDYIIYRESQGALGGNIHSNADYTFYIMKENGEIDKKYEILSYAPFSYNIVGDVSYENKRLHADVRKNPRTYGLSEEQKTARFLYQDGNLYEESYLTDCEMARMKDKRIFKADLPGVERELTIDGDNYTETSMEQYATGDTNISAVLCGCDNLELRFYIKTKLPGRNYSDAVYNQTVLGLIRFLGENTRYRSLLNKVHEQYIATGHSSEFEFDTTWECQIRQYTYNPSSHQLSMAIHLKNNTHKNQSENWDITIRQK